MVGAEFNDAINAIDNVRVEAIGSEDHSKNSFRVTNLKGTESRVPANTRSPAPVISLHAKDAGDMGSVANNIG